jgi:SagB-type dehydrogenase family enzyme
MAHSRYGFLASFEDSISTALRAHDLAQIERINLDVESVTIDETDPAAWTSVNLKQYPRLPKRSLPRANQAESMDLVDALINRRSVRLFDETCYVPLQTLGAIFDRAVSSSGDPQNFYHRPYPSAGARYPVETYLLSFRVQDLPPGIYHYDNHAHSLTTLLEKDFALNESEVLWDENIVSPAFVIILSAVFHRSCIKYAGRGYRYALFEAGAIAQTLDLVCRTKELGVVWIGGFPDGEVRELLDVNWEIELESPILLLAVGYENRNL